MVLRASAGFEGYLPMPLGAFFLGTVSDAVSLGALFLGMLQGRVASFALASGF